MPVSALVLVLVDVLAVGTVGTATAGGLTTKTVKKIATKVVTKKAAGLSVAHASSADSAGNAASLGGVPASAYAKRLFIRVSYTTATPTKVAGSDGVTVLGELALGRVTLSFPQDVSRCAMVGMSTNSGFPDIVRRSSVPTGLGVNTVTIAVDTPDPAATRSDFDLMAMC